MARLSHTTGIDHTTHIVLSEEERFKMKVWAQVRYIYIVDFIGSGHTGVFAKKIRRSGKPYEEGSFLPVDVGRLPEWLQELHRRHLARDAELHALVTQFEAEHKVDGEVTALSLAEQLIAEGS